MIKEAIGFGATVDEARDDALNKLGAAEDEDIQIEVINTPKKKILGMFGGSKAEVRVFVELPDPKPKREKKPAKIHNEKKTAAPAENAKAEKKVAPKKEKPVPKKTEETPAEDYSNAVDAASVPADSPAGRAVAYLTKILAGLGCENVQMKVAPRENGAAIILEGEGLGVIIGRRGETLDSLQYLASLAAKNGSGYFKVSLNIGDYRERRQQTLVSLAKRVSGQVIRTGRSRSLEPMNPYERRIIHTAIQEIEGVVSNSVGEGSRRRVVIYPEGADMTAPAPRERNDRRGGRGRGRDRRPSNTVATAPTREPKKDSDIPLYGKIN